MDKATAQGLVGVSGFVFITLGLVPLVQWFVFDHRSGLIGWLFRSPEGAWVWIVPAAIAVGMFAVMCWLDTQAKRA